MADKKDENVVTDGPHLAGPVYPPGQGPKEEEREAAPKAAPAVPPPNK